MRKLILILLTFVMFSCTPKDYGEKLDKQIGAIESYMSKVTTESNDGYNIQGGAYVRIIEIGEVETTPPAFGDLITFNYVEMVFTSEPKGILSTNIPEIAKAAKLDTPEDQLVPMVIEWGVTPLIPGLKGALMWVTKGEVIEAVIPFNLGYDDKWNSIVPPYTALAFNIEIIDIEKKK